MNSSDSTSLDATNEGRTTTQPGLSPALARMLKASERALIFLASRCSNTPERAAVILDEGSHLVIVVHPRGKVIEHLNNMGAHTLSAKLASRGPDDGLQVVLLAGNGDIGLAGYSAVAVNASGGVS